MRFPSKEAVERVKKEYPVGCRVELLQMDDPYMNKLSPGCKGTVKGVDDTGTILVSWDCNSSLGVVYGVDYCKKLDSVTVQNYGEDKLWDNRKEAIDFYKEAVLACEGSERKRYSLILLQLMAGSSFCSDEITD